jgi:signal transduction histidine kinase
MVFLGLSAVLLATSAFMYGRYTLSHQLEHRMARRMASLQHRFNEGGRHALLGLMTDLTQRGARTFAYTLVDRSGTVVTGVAEAARQPLGWSTLPLRDLDDQEVDDARALTRRLPDGSRLSVLADSDFIDQFDGTFFGFLFGAFGLLLSVALIGAAWLERIVRRRLDTIRTAAQFIIAGRSSVRMESSGRGDEFDAVCIILNSMLDRLDVALGDVRRVTSYIAHDLRAPLVRLRQDLSRTATDCSDRERCIVDLQAAAARCDEILEIHEAILAIGEIETLGSENLKALISLSDLMTELGEVFSETMAADGRSLNSFIAPDINMLGNRSLITQLLVNLLDNAAVHTPVGTRILMRLSSSDGEAAITIADDGGTQLDTAQRSVAIDRERLGLRLVEAIASAHAGSFRAVKDGGGMTVCLTFPIVPPRQ